MAGIPVASLNVYLEKFISAGVKVAVCEQTETAHEAKKNKRIVTREVTRLITPGTLHDEWLSSTRQNYLASVTISSDAKQAAVAWADISTGEFGMTITSVRAHFCVVASRRVLSWIA